MTPGIGLAMVENPGKIILQDSLELSEDIENYLWFLKCKFLLKKQCLTLIQSDNRIDTVIIWRSCWYIFCFIFRYSNLRQYWFANNIKYFWGLWKRFTQFQTPKLLEDTERQLQHAFTVPCLSPDFFAGEHFPWLQNPHEVSLPHFPAWALRM